MIFFDIIIPMMIAVLVYLVIGIILINTVTSEKGLGGKSWNLKMTLADHSAYTILWYTFRWPLFVVKLVCMIIVMYNEDEEDDNG